MTKLPTAVKQFDASNVSYRSRVTLLRRILVNMKAQVSGATNAGVLLAGDPGTGKTSLSRMFAQLLGMNLLVLEVPHVSEEHIINIPFIRYLAGTNKIERNVVSGEAKSDFELVLSKSNLLTQLARKDKIDDETYLKYMYNGKYSTNTRRIFEEFGGTKTSIPKVIADVRERFDTLLFLDEFFRRTSISVRNMLRGVLNRRLGLDKLPKNVYVLFASNITDDGVEEIPSNNQFNVIEVNRPGKDAWFGYVTNRSEELGITLDSEVVDIFFETVAPEQDPDDSAQQEDHRKKLIYGDPSQDGIARISPRRLEQMLHYVNASFPIKNLKAARGLVSNMALNFTNYKTGEVNSTGYLFLGRLIELINERATDYKLTTIEDAILPPHRWRDTLHHQIMRKVKLGETRTYIPTISGPPGIGKTTAINSICASFNLGEIYIDCSTLSAEDVTGTPMSVNHDDGTISTSFSDSKLSIIIDRMAKENDPGASTKNGYKYIIFFDELNRTTTKTFNSLRKLLLEQEFENGKKLPEGSIIVAAINPEDSGGGVTELTQHMTDVMDIIRSAPNWDSFSSWLHELNTGINEPSLELSMLNIIERFVQQFGDANHVEPQFNLNLGTESSLYISPRDYTQIYAEGAIALDEELIDCRQEYGFTNYDGKASYAQNVENRMRLRVAESYIGVITGILYKNGLDGTNVLSALETWFATSPEANPMASFVQEEVTARSIEAVLEDLLANTDSQPLAEITEAVNFFTTESTESVVRVVEEFWNKLFKGSWNSQAYPIRKFDAANDTFEETGKGTALTFLFNEVFNVVRAHSLPQSLGDSLRKSVTEMIGTLVRTLGLTDDVYKLTQEMSDHEITKI